MEFTFVEGDDLGFGVAEKDGRVGGDDELGVLVLAQGVVEQDEEGELALRGEGGFGFVEERGRYVGICGRRVKKVSPWERVWRLWPP